MEGIPRRRICFRLEPEKCPHGWHIIRDGADGSCRGSGLVQCELWTFAHNSHVHSEESGDATATFAQIETLAHDQGLDFVEITDHNTVSQHGRQAAEQAHLTDLLLLRGAEVTTYAGHGNALGASAYVDHRVGLDGVNATTIVQAVRAQGDLFIVNHPTISVGNACIGCAWRLDGTPWDDVAGIEIHNGNYGLAVQLFTPGAIAMWDMLEDEGHKLAPTGGSDDHNAGMGTGITASPIGSPTTLVWADELSEAGIMAGVAAGRTQVLLRGPGDPYLDMTIEDLRVGDTFTFFGGFTLHVKVVGTPKAATKLVIYRNGIAVTDVDVVGADFEHGFDFATLPGHARYRAQLEESGKPIVVTGHIYVVQASLGGEGGVHTTDAPVATPDAPVTMTAGGDGGCNVGGRPSVASVLALAILVFTRAFARGASRARRA